MAHLLSSVEVKNFRSCCDSKFLLSELTPLVGYNNAGKSNVLSAIQWLIKKAKLQESDFSDLDQAIEVIGIVDGVSEEVLDQLGTTHRNSIVSYVHDERLKIRRLQESPVSAPNTINLTVWDWATNDWVPNPTGIDNAIKQLLPEPIRIGAMENAEEDATKSKNTTTIGKLLGQFLGSVSDEHGDELQAHLDEVNRRVSCDGDSRLSELDTIDENVNEQVEILFPGMSVKLDFRAPTVEELIKSGTIRVYEGTGSGRDFSAYGHGAQRSIQIALVKHLAEVKRGTVNESRTTILLIDEPELYLHPFALEQVREALISLSSNGYQIVFSTHSAQMVKSDYADKTLLIRKTESLGTHSRARLKDAIQSCVPDSTHQMEQLFSLGHSTQVLFSEKVVLTEGKTESRLMPFLYEKETGRTFGQDKFALVSQSGVSDTKKSLDILNEMDLPACAIVDLDYAFTNAIRDGFLDESDSDIAELKIVLDRLASDGLITTGPNGLPKKGVVKAYQAYEILACETEAIPSIENIHKKLREQGIWLWKKGAIEAHLGLDNKTEGAWAIFMASVSDNGLRDTCDDYQSVSELISWLND